MPYQAGRRIVQPCPGTVRQAAGRSRCHRREGVTRQGRLTPDRSDLDWRQCLIRRCFSRAGSAEGAHHRREPLFLRAGAAAIFLLALLPAASAAADEDLPVPRFASLKSDEVNLPRGSRRGQAQALGLSARGHAGGDHRGVRHLAPHPRLQGRGRLGERLAALRQAHRHRHRRAANSACQGRRGGACRGRARSRRHRQADRMRRRLVPARR